MNRRTLLLGAGAVGLGGGSLAAWLRAGPPSATAQAADSFDDLRERFRTFRTVMVDATWGGGGITLAASGQTRRVAVKIGAGWYLWRNGRITEVDSTRGDNPCPGKRELPSPAMFGELWDELRTGFANSVVTRDRPEDLGSRWPLSPYPGDIRMVRLPFEWAVRHRLFLQYRPSGRIAAMAILRDDGAEVATPWPFLRSEARLGPILWRWNVPLPAGIFSTAYPLIHPAGWEPDERHRSIRDTPGRGYEHCEAEQGHHHGDDLEREHTFEEIEGCGTPVSETRWDPSCEAPDPDDPCTHPPHPPHPPAPPHPEPPPHPVPGEGKQGKGKGGN